jgi:hypothetical protein
MAEELETVTVTATNPDQSLQAFMNQDFLKSSQFMFVLPTLPFDYSIVSPKNPRGFSMFCESVEFPGKNTQAVDYKIPGKNRIRVPYGKEFPEVTMTFIHNINIPVYDIFSFWIDWIIQENNSIESRYFDESVVDFTLFQYSEFPAEPYGRFRGLNSILNDIDKINRYLFDSKRLFKATDIGQEFISNINNVSGLSVSKQTYYTVQFKNAYPLSFAPMPSNWADEGFHRLSVTFTYESYTINDSSKGSKTSQLEQLTNYKLKSETTSQKEFNRSLDEILKQNLFG